ncbi:hypothetical protein AB0C40_14785 [Streptomyces brevispora]|uniref:Uncharacterized protein n=1 Tax=Streptomyces brevispora TaxID=887462 RepID=A0A561UV56_9ACTN|nr:hypothetical protein [Streptomyces brevispora]TWG03241.1 hypothetical protein FHX80_111661 [Streptomyces brevispora]WSC15718.1 hypothetical protein OIE64_24730 [Streptomyces brevispora]
MTQLRTAQRPRSRRVIGRTLLAAALLTAVAAVPAAAAAAPQGAPATAPAHRDRDAPRDQLVAHFYGSYLDAIAAEGGGRLATALRSFYLTPALRAELKRWEARNHADGVLRSQDVPAGFRVTASDSGAGHTWSTVRLTWGTTAHRTYTYLSVRQDLGTGKISAIQD